MILSRRVTGPRFIGPSGPRVIWSLMTHGRIRAAQRDLYPTGAGWPATMGAT